MKSGKSGPRRSRRQTPCWSGAATRPDGDITMTLIDDDTAVKVTDGTVEVVSAGHWKLFNA